jgi:hypothetical protein
MWIYAEEGEEEEERNRCRIVGLAMVLESDARIGRMELAMVPLIRNHCVLVAREKALLTRTHCALAELEKVREIHSHVFEEQVPNQYYRECS